MLRAGLQGLWAVARPRMMGWLVVLPIMVAKATAISTNFPQLEVIPRKKIMCRGNVVQPIGRID